MLVMPNTKIMVIKVGMMKILEEVMDLILEVIGKELIIKGEMVGLALGWVSGLVFLWWWASC